MTYTVQGQGLFTPTGFFRELFLREVQRGGGTGLLICDVTGFQKEGEPQGLFSGVGHGDEGKVIRKDGPVFGQVHGKREVDA